MNELWTYDGTVVPKLTLFSDYMPLVTCVFVVWKKSTLRKLQKVVFIVF